MKVSVDQVKLGQRRYCPAYLSWRWVVVASVSFLVGNQMHLLLSHTSLYGAGTRQQVIEVTLQHLPEPPE